VAIRSLKKLEFHYMPKHGGWLTLFEIELSVSMRQGWQIRWFIQSFIPILFEKLVGFSPPIKRDVIVATVLLVRSSDCPSAQQSSARISLTTLRNNTLTLSASYSRRDHLVA